MLKTLLSLIAAGLLASATAIAGSPCVTAVLDPAPSRFSGITWDWPYAHLLLLDSAAGEVRTYSTSGGLVSRWANPGSGAFEFSRPLFLVRTSTGYILQDGGYHYIELDKDLKPFASHDLEHDRSVERGTTGGAVHWAGTAGGIVGYGSVQHADQTWATGLLRVTWSPEVRFDMLREFPSDPARQQPYMLGVATTATCGGRDYLLGFGEDYGLFEVNGSKVRLLRGLPPAFGKLPDLPPARGMANSVERSLALAGSTAAAHLYSDAEHLYVVLRDTRSGTKKWLLARYDTEAERISGVWLLPSSAMDVLLAPGPDQWALLELASRTPAGAMVPGKLVLFASRRLATPVGTADAPVALCER